MAAISGERTNDERVKCLRIFADGNGETHMEDIDITLQPRKLFKDNPPLRLSENLLRSWLQGESDVCYVSFNRRRGNVPHSRFDFGATGENTE